MAVHGSQDLKIFSSVRPLQIQRSFEGPSEVADIVGSITRDGTVEKHSSVTITSQTSSPSMSTVNLAAEVAPSSPFSFAPGTAHVQSSGASAAPTEAPSNTPGGWGQNVVIIRNPSGVAPTGSAPQMVPTLQSKITIKSATTGSQPNAQSKILINPAPLTQSRITITGGVSPIPTAPQTVETEVVGNETPPTQAPPQARRSSLTIKTAPNPTSPTPVTVNSPAQIQQQNAVVIDGPPPTQSTVSEQVPQEATFNEHPTPEPSRPSTAAPVSASEDLSEKIHQKKPAGPSLEEILEKFDASKVFYVAFAVVVVAVVCILTDGEVPLSWILAAISVVSLGSFIALRL